MARKDKNALMKMNSASNHSKSERAEHDFYATPTRMVGELCKHEWFSPQLWEPCVGMGHISNYFEDKGKPVLKSDIVQLIDDVHIQDIFAVTGNEYPEWLEPYHTGQNKFTLNIITNPPYNMGTEFYDKACSLLAHGYKLAIFVKIQFLETQKRYELFKKYPPKKVLICVNRVHCGKDGIFNNDDASGGAACYCWLIYEAGYEGPCTIDWINQK